MNQKDFLNVLQSWVTLEIQDFSKKGAPAIKLKQVPLKNANEEVTSLFEVKYTTRSDMSAKLHFFVKKYNILPYMRICLLYYIKQIPTISEDVFSLDGFKYADKQMLEIETRNRNFLGLYIPSIVLNDDGQATCLPCEAGYTTVVLVDLCYKVYPFEKLGNFVLPEDPTFPNPRSDIIARIYYAIEYDPVTSGGLPVIARKISTKLKLSKNTGDL